MPKVPSGMRAMYEGPIRGAAEVWVNGKRVGPFGILPSGSTWQGLLAPGSNRIEVRVANLAVNAMAGRPLPD